MFLLDVITVSSCVHRLLIVTRGHAYKLRRAISNADLAEFTVDQPIIRAE